MTDNEKRAHDLAIASLPMQYLNSNSEKGIDIYRCYLDCYETALDAFNRDFPDGK